MTTLMELVTAGETFTVKTVDTLKAYTRVDQLEKLGFVRAAKHLKLEVDLRERHARLAEFKYITITKENIESFLRKRADEYNKTRTAVMKKAREVSSLGDYVNSSIQWPSIDLNNRALRAFRELSGTSNVFSSDTEAFAMWVEKNSTCMVQTVDYTSSDKRLTGAFTWMEESIDRYPGIPPAAVLDIFEVHKARKIFDYFTVASVKGIPDPLLLGRLKGDDNRYFIAQWGDDVALDDLI